MPFVTAWGLNGRGSRADTPADHVLLAAKDGGSSGVTGLEEDSELALLR